LQLGVAWVLWLQFVAGLPVGHAERPRRVHGPSGDGLEHTIYKANIMQRGGGGGVSGLESNSGRSDGGGGAIPAHW
jgi:hypothetical protein